MTLQTKPTFYQPNLTILFTNRYSDMMLDVEKIMNDPERAQFVKKDILCQTLAGNDVPILTITSSDPVYDIRNKKFVIVTSRVHPGETPSSFIMKGILHYITGMIPDNFLSKHF